jgi:hypothetical protein
MEQERRPPPAYAQHEHEYLHLPSVPTHNPSHSRDNDRLPGIRSLALPDASATVSARIHRPPGSIELSPRSQADQSQWSSLPPLGHATFPRVPERIPRTSNDTEMGSPMDTASVKSAQEENGWRRDTSVLSVDDPDVRLAAEALSGLGNPGASSVSTNSDKAVGLQLTLYRLRPFSRHSLYHSTPFAYH